MSPARAQPAATRPASRSTSAAAAGLVALLSTAGVAHFARPEPFERLIPDRLGSPRAWVLASGAAELACAAAIAWPRTRRLGGIAAAVLFVGVFPGNITMARDSGPFGPPWTRRSAIAWGRLPLQVPLVTWALAVARGEARA